MNKRVLIVSYYYPPCTGAPSWRALSWASRFSEKGIEAVVLTRHWNGDESTWEQFVKPNYSSERVVQESGAEVHYLPSRTIFLNRFFKGRTWLSNIYYLTLALLGHFNPEIDARLTFRRKLKVLLRAGKFDAVIITSPPSNVLRLTRLVKKYSQAVLIADIRDLWNNMMLRENYSPPLSQQVWDKCYSFYYRRWLKHVDAITMVIGQFGTILDKLTDKPKFVVYNGYEAALFKVNSARRSRLFVFSVVGSLYPDQDLSVMLEGLKAFLMDKDPDVVKIRFIGLESVPEVADAVRASLPSSFITTTGRISKEEAVRETKEATVLSYAGWKGVKGIISTKIFDYMASGNPILIAPGDNDIIDQLLEASGTGRSVYSASEFKSCLNNWYEAWKQNAEMGIEPNRQFIEGFSREKQADALWDIIDALLIDKRTGGNPQGLGKQEIDRRITIMDTRKKM